MAAYIDTHAHLTGETLYPAVESIIARATQAGVKQIINICTDPDNFTKGLYLAATYNHIYNAAAVHPHDAATLMKNYFPLVETAAKEGKLVAIGETGLDYFYTNSEPEKQKEALIRHILLAKETNLPLVIHCREAFKDFYSILDIHGKDGPRGVLHCFTGTQQEADEALKRDWYISFSGIITFKKSEALRDVVKNTPIEKILIETDAPYLAPQSQRGKSNEPAFVIETAATIAQVKNLSVDEVAHITTGNAHTLFKLGNTSCL